MCKGINGEVKEIRKEHQREAKKRRKKNYCFKYIVNNKKNFLLT